jgi:hypothetical protein
MVYVYDTRYTDNNTSETLATPTANMMPPVYRDTPSSTIIPISLAPAIPLPVVPVPVHHAKRQHYFHNRMLLCLLAVACNWVTTLRVSKHFASSVIEVPPFDAVIKTCRSAYNVTNEERQRYSQCVESRLNRCNRRMDKSIRKEDERVRTVSTRNEEILTNMEEITSSCSRSYTTFRLALEEWIANGGNVPVRSNTSGSGNELECSEADQQSFGETLLAPQNVMALQTEAMDIATTYSEESTVVVSNLAEYIVQRAEYDVNYIDQKTEAIQNAFIAAVDFTPKPSVSIDDLLEELELAMVDLLACISLDENSRQSDGTKCSPNLARMVNKFYDDAVFKVEVLKVSLRDYRDRMIQYKKNVDRAYKVAKAFYDGVNNVMTKAIIGLFTGSWFDISATDFLAVDVAFPDVESIFRSIGSFDSIESLWSQVVPDVDGYYDNLAHISDGIKARFDGMVDGLVDAYNTNVRQVPLSLPEDYDPPQYMGTMDAHSSAEKEASFFVQKSKAFQSKSRDTLGLFSGIGGQYDEDQRDMKVPTFNITEIRNKVTNIDLSFENFQEPDFDFDLWFLKLNFLSDGFVFADYIFRAYITARLITKYWSATSLAMPQIDIRSNKETKNPFRQHPALAAITFVTSPIGGFMIFVACSTWLIGMIAALYVPFLQQYTSGCVRLGDGTFLTKNLFSFAYNHAYQDGSGLLVEGMDAYDMKRGDSCNARYASSVTLQNNMNANLTAYTNFHQELSQNMGLSRRCVDSTELDSLFQDACCGLGTYPECQSISSQHVCPMDERLDIPLPYELPGIALNDISCSVEVDGSDWILSDAIFDCESIPTCSIECELPRKPLLSEASEQCGCTLEWYIHSQWMGTALAFVIYLCMNVARVLFFAGLTRVLWKQIHPERFTVVATCNSDGALVTSKRVSGDSHQDLMLAIQSKSNKSEDETTSHHELSATLNAKLDRCIRNFYRVGVALVISSLVVNVTWLTFVMLTSRSLTPRVWQQ